MRTTHNHIHALNPLIVDPDSSTNSEDESDNGVFFVLCEICY
jgi:hypothetical protein